MHYMFQVHYIHQTKLLGFLCIDSLARESHVKGVEGASEGWQSLGAATTWQHTQQHLRQPHAGLESINSNPVVAGHGNLKASSETRSLDGSNNWLAAFLNLKQEILASLGQFCGFFSSFTSKQSTQILNETDFVLLYYTQPTC